MTGTCFPERVRVSTGSAIVTGLLKGKLDAKPTTLCVEKKSAQLTAVSAPKPEIVKVEQTCSPE